MGKGQPNGFHNGNATMGATGNTSVAGAAATNNINGKFATRNLYERAKQYCSQGIDNIKNIDSNLSSKLNQMEKSSRFKNFDNDDSESDALLSGDEHTHFDVEFTDDDCVALHEKPRGPHS